MTLTRERCDVSNDGCNAPANLGELLVSDRAVVECFGCGNPVCRNRSCSRIVNWYYHGRRRVCVRCLLA